MILIVLCAAAFRQATTSTSLGEINVGANHQVHQGLVPRGGLSRRQPGVRAFLHVEVWWQTLDAGDHAPDVRASTAACCSPYANVATARAVYGPTPGS